MWRIKEEAKVEATFTTISKFWSVHPSYLAADIAPCSVAAVSLFSKTWK